MKPQKTSALKYFWQFAKNYKISFFLGFFASGVTVIFGFILTPILLKMFIDAITSFDGANRIEILPELLRIWGFIVIVNVFAFVCAGRIFDFSVTYFQTSVLRDLSIFSFRKLQNHSMDFFANNFVGSLVSKMRRFTFSFERLDDLFKFNLFPNLIRFTISISIVFFFSRIIGAVLLVWILVYFSIVYFFVTRIKMPLSLKSAAADSRNTGVIADTITNAVTIKMFARIKFEIEKYTIVAEKLFAKIWRKEWNTENYFNILKSIMMSGLEVMVMYLMIKLWVAGEITVGTIVLIQSYLMQIYMNLWDFGRVIKDFFKAIADADEMIEILAKEPEIQDVKNPEKCKISRGEIEFKNVKFSYDDKSDSVFEKLNLKIKPGERIGIVGESGAGKTTITKLILRFSEINSGKILIDGQDISKIKQDDLRAKIAFVPQEPVLFHRSLFENIKYGDPEADDEAVFATAKKSHAEIFISKMPKKYQTLVGERGIKLSGGERQRIAIARAMLKNTPILVLDEATSALDSKSEKLIQDALENLMKNRTTMVIAHRLSTLRKMDRIIVFDDGKIVETGSHEELLRNKDGVYFDLWKEQVGGFTAQ